jgi:hypothetical protein
MFLANIFDRMVCLPHGSLTRGIAAPFTRSCCSQNNSLKRKSIRRHFQKSHQSSDSFLVKQKMLQKE